MKIVIKEDFIQQTKDEVVQKWPWEINPFKPYHKLKYRVQEIPDHIDDDSKSILSKTTSSERSFL